MPARLFSYRCSAHAWHSHYSQLDLVSSTTYWTQACAGRAPSSSCSDWTPLLNSTGSEWHHPGRQKSALEKVSVMWKLANGPSLNYSTQSHCLMQVITGVHLDHCNCFNATDPLDFHLWSYYLPFSQPQDSIPYNRVLYLQFCFHISLFSKELSPKHNRSSCVPRTREVPEHVHLWISPLVP